MALTTKTRNTILKLIALSIIIFIGYIIIHIIDLGKPVDMTEVDIDIVPVNAGNTLTIDATKTFLTASSSTTDYFTSKQEVEEFINGNIGLYFSCDEDQEKSAKYNIKYYHTMDYSNYMNTNAVDSLYSQIDQSTQVNLDKISDENDQSDDAKPNSKEQKIYYIVRKKCD